MHFRIFYRDLSLGLNVVLNSTERRRSNIAICHICSGTLRQAAWAKELEILQEVLVKNIFRHLLYHACILLHKFLLIFHLQLLKLLSFLIDLRLIFLLRVISCNCWAKTLHRLLHLTLLIQPIAMNRAVRDKVMMLWFLISNSLGPFDHGLLSIYWCFRWLLESHLHRLISHRVVGNNVTSDTAPGPWLPNRSLLHQY